MARKCTICTSKHLLRVNRARYVEGLTHGRIADRFKLALSTVKRHFTHAEPPPTALTPNVHHAPDAEQLAALASPGSLRVACRVCPSEHRPDIERGLVANMGLKRLETMYGISEETIERHASLCIPEMLERAKALSTVRRAVDGIPELFAEVRDLLFQAKAARDFPTWAAAIQRLERALNLLSKLTGEAQGPSTWERILQSKEWAAVREAHDRALAPYPEAAAALKAELLKATAA